jgi:hypothetical protein
VWLRRLLLLLLAVQVRQRQRLLRGARHEVWLKRVGGPGRGGEGHGRRGDRRQWLRLRPLPAATPPWCCRARAAPSGQRRQRQIDGLRWRE